MYICYLLLQKMHTLTARGHDGALKECHRIADTRAEEGTTQLTTHLVAGCPSAVCF